MLRAPWVPCRHAAAACTQTPGSGCSAEWTGSASAGHGLLRKDVIGVRCQVLSGGLCKECLGRLVECGLFRLLVRSFRRGTRGYRRHIVIQDSTARGRAQRAAQASPGRYLRAAIHMCNAAQSYLTVPYS